MKESKLSAEISTEPTGVRTDAPERDAAFVEECAQVVLDAIVSQAEKAWADRVKIAREDKAWTARQFVFNCIAQILDHGKHLEVTNHPYVQGGMSMMGERTCELESCQRSFSPKVPGQRFCSQECGLSYFKAHKPPQPEPRKAPVSVSRAR